MQLFAGETLTVRTRVDTTNFRVQYEFDVLRGEQGDFPVVPTIHLSSADMIGVNWGPASAKSPVAVVPLGSLPGSLPAN